MLTVLAIDKSLFCELDDFESLFQNVAQKGEFKLCSWNRDGKNLVEAIPALFDRHFISENELRSWNILIVSDNRQCQAQNPFSGDYLADKDSLPDPQLNEVAKMLGIVPTDSHSSYELPDNKFGNIKWNVEVSRKLRNEKLEQYDIFDFPRPNKIFLFSVTRKLDVDIDEFSHSKSLYNEFRTQAKYPVNCRFLKFNLSTVSNRSIKEDYFRLWMTLLTFVFNNPDEIYLAPDVLYNIDSVIDKKNVEKQVSEIYSRVHFVKKTATINIAEIKKMRELMKKKHYDIPDLDSSVLVNFETDEKGLYLNNKKFGLASNCPCNDQVEYDNQREVIEKNIKEYLKAPKRAVKRAVNETKEQGVYIPASSEKIQLDENQTEDLVEKLDDLELSLFSTSSVDSTYEQKNAKSREICDEDNHKIMEKRSPVSSIIIGSAVAFAAVLVGFIPYIINAFVTQNNATVANSFMITFLTILLMMIAGIIALVVMRAPLSGGLKRFKNLIRKLINDTNDLAQQYTVYLSKLSTFMKGCSFKTYLDSNKDVYMQEEEACYIKNSEFSDKREELCRRWADMFDFQLRYNEKKVDKSFEIDNYPEKNPLYNFVLKSGEYKILLNGKRSNLTAPYEFIKSISIKLEEDA